MAEADAALARLDEKIVGYGVADGLVERIAYAEAEALARLLGWRGRDGDSALTYRYEAAVEDEHDAWTRQPGRMLAAGVVDIAVTAAAAELAARLRNSGWRRRTVLDAADALADGAGPEPDRAERLWLAAWLDAARAFGDFGPTARGAMSFQARVAGGAAGGAGGLTTVLTGAVAAMRLGAGASKTTLRFTPLGMAARRRRPFDRLGAAERLARWSICVAESCRAHAAEVERLLAWRAAAWKAERTKTGEGPSICCCAAVK